MTNGRTKTTEVPAKIHQVSPSGQNSQAKGADHQETGQDGGTIPLVVSPTRCLVRACGKQSGPTPGVVGGSLQRALAMDHFNP
jgi:hypothetical protein